ncbi:hypothetical protein DOY81_011500 [Sarcophaga bullata]|nr:hypothetical protein DOY81_011500 [Sarcophaga bullata]
MILGAFPISTKNATTTAAANNKNGKCRFLFLCGGYILFLILGAAMFSAIEAPKIDVISKRVETFRNQFLDKYTCLNDDDLEEFLKAVITANDRGISPLRNATNEMNWSFGQALFFSSTVVTTIVIIVAIIFFAIPTAVFAYLEPSWGVLDAFYYCFISLTTIGLGTTYPVRVYRLIIVPSYKMNYSLFSIWSNCYDAGLNHIL